MLRLVIFRSVLLFVAVLPLLGITTAVAQPNVSQNPPGVDEETYENVIELVFPREVLKEKKIRFAFVLRYQPTFRAESQIVVVGRSDGIEVTTYKSLDGNIETKLNDKVRNGAQESAEELAKLVRIEKRTVTLPSTSAGKFHADFFEALRRSEKTRFGPAPKSINVVADGTTYRIWYAGSTEIQCDLQGTGIASPTAPDEPALIEWMKDVSRRLLH